MTPVTFQPVCRCVDPLVFGHASCPLGPRWLEEAEKKRTEREARHRQLREQGRERQAWMEGLRVAGPFSWAELGR